MSLNPTSSVGLPAGMSPMDASTLSGAEPSDTGRPGNTRLGCSSSSALLARAQKTYDGREVTVPKAFSAVKPFAGLELELLLPEKAMPPGNDAGRLLLLNRLLMNAVDADATNPKTQALASRADGLSMKLIGAYELLPTDPAKARSDLNNVRYEVDALLKAHMPLIKAPSISLESIYMR
jgi:hypothetical protein